MKISIAIPSWDYSGWGEECLEYSFQRMKEQTFKDFDVIISDSSIADDIKNLCERWENKLDIKYFDNKKAKGNPARNFNNAISMATGEWIKILGQDDFLLYPTSLETIVNSIDEKYNWLATGYLHTYDRENFERYHSPYLNPRIYVVNTIGNPSCVTIKNTEYVMPFDESLYYCFDCEFYYRYFLEYGPPKIVEDPTIANYLWNESISSKIQNETIEKENRYILEKHGFAKNVRDN